MQIDSSYAEADIGNIHKGQPATFRVDAFPDRNFKGEVSQVRLNPTTQQNVVTYDVVIAVDNSDQALMPGMTAYVSITVAQRKEALLVPNAALRFRPSETKPGAGKRGGGGGAQGSRKEGHGKDKGAADAARTGTVYVLEKGQLKPIQITLGITDNRFTEVLGGEIKEGAAAVVEDSQPPAKGPGGPPGMRLF